MSARSLCVSEESWSNEYEQKFLQLSRRTAAELRRVDRECEEHETRLEVLERRTKAHHEGLEELRSWRRDEDNGLHAALAEQEEHFKTVLSLERKEAHGRLRESCAEIVDHLNELRRALLEQRHDAQVQRQNAVSSTAQASSQIVQTHVNDLRIALEKRLHAKVTAVAQAVDQQLLKVQDVELKLPLVEERTTRLEDFCKGKDSISLEQFLLSEISDVSKAMDQQFHSVQKAVEQNLPLLDQRTARLEELCKVTDSKAQFDELRISLESVVKLIGRLEEQIGHVQHALRDGLTGAETRTKSLEQFCNDMSGQVQLLHKRDEEYKKNFPQQLDEIRQGLSGLQEGLLCTKSEDEEHRVLRELEDVKTQMFRHGEEINKLQERVATLQAELCKTGEGGSLQEQILELHQALLSLQDMVKTHDIAIGQGILPEQFRGLHESLLSWQGTAKRSDELYDALSIQVQRMRGESEEQGMEARKGFARMEDHVQREVSRVLEAACNEARTVHLEVMSVDTRVATLEEWFMDSPSRFKRLHSFAAARSNACQSEAVAQACRGASDAVEASE